MIAVIDYGLGNLKSVSNALEAVGAQVKVTNKPEDIALAEAIVLPGVGAFQRAMDNLTELDIIPAILKAIKEGRLFLGICLGLQILFTESEEHGICKGLDIIKGRVKRFDSSLKIPHVGWNQVKVRRPAGRKTLFKNVPDNSYFYFVHSYYVEPDDENLIAATTGYGKDFVSVINKNNFWGVQFHPEKSGELGLKVLKNFLTNTLSHARPFV